MTRKAAGSPKTPAATRAATSKPARRGARRLVLYSIGHSTRPIGEFAELLAASGVRELIDIRAIPRSRHMPEYNEPALKRYLARRGVRYLHLDKLGGLRKARKDSKNTALRNASFRGYADHMQTPEFEAGLTRLLKEASRRTVAFMCAEAVP